MSTAGAAPAFEDFRLSLAGEVVRPGEADYDYGIRRWADNVSIQAVYVVFPRGNEDIAAAIKFARLMFFDIAICGGGHSWSGTSSTKGLLIHLGKYMNGVRFDHEASAFYVGGGATWEAVDKAGAPHGMATVAGTVNHTGVGGLVLGGGYGWLTGRHGLALDNLIQITVVLASGEIVIANDTENPDLFWGCRGAGSNFGAVTEFVLKAHPQRATVFLTRLVYDIEKSEAVINAVEKWSGDASPDEQLTIGCFRRAPNWEPSLAIMYFYNGTSEQGREAAKLLYDAGPIKEIPSDNLPYIELNTQQNAGLAWGGRKYCKGNSVPRVTGEIMSTLIDDLKQTVATYPDFRNCGFIFEYTGKKAVCKVPTEATAFSKRGTNRECLAWIFYENEDSDTAARDEVRRWSADIGKVSGGSATGYVNYEPEPTTGAEGVFGPNYARLREVKAKYDPDKVFHKWFPIEPAAAQDAS